MFSTARRGVQDGLPPLLTWMLIRWALHVRSRDRQLGGWAGISVVGRLMKGGHIPLGHGCGARMFSSVEIPEDVELTGLAIAKLVDEYARRAVFVYYGFYASAEAKGDALGVHPDTMRARVKDGRSAVYVRLAPYIEAHPMNLPGALSGILDSRARRRAPKIRHLVDRVSASGGTLPP